MAIAGKPGIKLTFGLMECRISQAIAIEISRDRRGIGRAYHAVKYHLFDNIITVIEMRLTSECAIRGATDAPGDN